MNNEFTAGYNTCTYKVLRKTDTWRLWKANVFNILGIYNVRKHSVTDLEI